MLDILGNAAAVVITFITLAGFLGIAGVFFFEVGTMIYFWVKHSLSDSRGERTNELSRSGFRRVHPT